jgi:hypothetical protein
MPCLSSIRIKPSFAEHVTSHDFVRSIAANSVFRSFVRLYNRSKAAIRQSLSNALPRDVGSPLRKNDGRTGLSCKPIRYGGSPFTAAVLDVKRYDPNGSFQLFGSRRYIVEVGARDFALAPGRSTAAARQFQRRIIHRDFSGSGFPLQPPKIHRLHKYIRRIVR